MASRQRSNVTRYWCDPRVPGLSLLQADFTDHEYRPHIHAEMVLAVTESGGAIISSRGVEAEARPDTLFVLNAGEVQAARMGRSQRWAYRSFYFGEAALLDICRGLGLGKVPSFACKAIADAELIAGFLMLHRAVEQQDDTFEIREQLIQSFARLLECHATASPPLDAGSDDRALYAQVAATVRARHLEELRLEDLASTAGLTVFQLIRLFKRVSGLTPHAYLVQLRLDDVRRHLRNGMPIAEAATAAGFYDQSALTNQFRRSYGITPKQFATAVRR